MVCRQLTILVGLALFLTACASLTAERNQPLLAQGPARGPEYRLTAIDDHTSKELFLAVAFSGGGKRSAAFGYGALTALKDITLAYNGTPSRLSDEIDFISGVSGGSFTASAFGFMREAFWQNYRTEFLYHDLNAEIFAIYLQPWRWDWLVNPDWGTNDEMARVYDDILFKDARFDRLAKLGRPLVAIQATDFANEQPFIFTQDTFDLLCSDLSTFPIARAVAASNGFPILFSPISLNNYNGSGEGQCKRPTWINEYLKIQDEFSRRRHHALQANRYLTQKEGGSYVHLLDGGVGDNLALRGLIQLMVPPDKADPEFFRDLRKIQHVVVISVDGQSEPDRDLNNIPVLSSVFRIVGAVTSTAIDRLGFETLVHAREMTERLAARLAAEDCPSPVPCRSVEAHFAHVSLADLADDARRRELASIPTGLTIADEDVDALIQAGYDAVLCDPQMRKLFSRLPKASLPRQTPGRCAGALPTRSLQ
ncbi:MAG TPA: hypothetical protein DCL54_15790 [Alphaproteobacteria bacterium]|nr:hypothetical protein [Alphaproteobacteria bacterium]HAJ48035.1 hypothetical protein [Alphaproteobacteria bacterium]